MEIIAYFYGDFPEKFGIPRQSGLVSSLKGRIVFEPDYRNVDAFRGLDEFSHIWLIWQFSQSVGIEWSPTVRPPRLGGNARVGVFASRSPFRPNPLGLSVLKLEKIDFQSEQGPVLHVSGADLMSGTPIFDVKPYLPYADCHVEAVGGYADRFRDYKLTVRCPQDFLQMLPPDRRETLMEVLAQDPRPSYQSDPERVYGMSFAGFQVQFKVEDSLLTVCGLREVREETGRDAGKE